MGRRPFYDRRGVTIYHGDCREILPELMSSVAAVVTDPPYGLRLRGLSKTGANAHVRIAGDDTTDLRDWIVRTCRTVLPLIVFGSPKVVRPDRPRGILIWDKGPSVGMGDLSFPWKPSHEEIYVFGRGWHGHRDPGVLRCLPPHHRGKQRQFHPTEKPVALMRELVKKAPDGAICDPCMGSGSTLLAARELSRPSIGIEIEEKYCTVAAQRLTAFEEEWGG